jgi:diguanylate cyclase (GGDEF)-like protein
MILAVVLPLLFFLVVVVAAALLINFSSGRGAEETAVQSAADSAKLDRLVHGYHEILADVAQRLGVQGRSIAAAGRLMDMADEEMSAELKTELTGRLNEIIAKNNQLRRDLYLAQQQLSAQHAELARARAESRIDFLTQLPNRRAFEEKASELQACFERHQTDYALVIFDIDFFKSFNDNHGHAAGDAMLRTVGKTAMSIRRTADFLARIGGEEFALLFPHTGLEQGHFAAERYRAAIAATKLWVEGRQLAVNASFGVAAIQHGETFADLLVRADEALYQAKESGRNRVCLHDGSHVTVIAAETVR